MAPRPGHHDRRARSRRPPPPGHWRWDRSSAPCAPAPRSRSPDWWSLLSAEGPTQLTVRTVAARAGVSVQAVYTLFGGKPGLCEALFEEGFAALQTALDAVEASAGPEKDFGEPVVGQALAY